MAIVQVKTGLLRDLDQFPESIRKRVELEKKIGRKLVRTLLQANFWIGINNGGDEDEYPPALGETLILGRMWETDEDYLKVFQYDETNKKPKKEAFGWVRLIYGENGYDLIADHTVNLSQWVDPVQEYAESLQKD